MGRTEALTTPTLIVSYQLLLLCAVPRSAIPNRASHELLVIPTETYQHYRYGYPYTAQTAKHYLPAAL